MAAVRRDLQETDLGDILTHKIPSRQQWRKEGDVNQRLVHHWPYMTLIGPEMMATVHSTNKKGIAVMVQQYWENAHGWDGNSNYHGLPLDFVDNDESSVPGQ